MECHDTTCEKHNQDEPFCDEMICIKSAGYKNLIQQTTHNITVSNKPSAYRLAKKGKKYVLQCLIEWSDGVNHGSEWTDMPTVTI